uniref:Uncharacterized protein n=1 Tax=Glossina palpalis gambiensis TaxID=67801 RepID=A0A1B0ALC0_9MUSC
MAPGFYLNMSAPVINTSEIIQLAAPIDGPHWIFPTAVDTRPVIESADGGSTLPAIVSRLFSPSG